MHKTKKERKYYIFDCIENKYLAVYEGENALIEGIAFRYNHELWWNRKISNRLLDEYNCTMCDTINQTETIGGRQELRRYVVFDDLYRIIDVRIYKEKILSYGLRYTNNGNRKFRPSKEDEKGKPQFRKGPVPHTGGGRWHFYRHPRTRAELRDMSAPENEKFIRKKRKRIPTTWDDLPRNMSRCWKDQSKKRRQWM